jgi:transcriptional regulator of acetoin/glycerol metabolism
LKVLSEYFIRGWCERMAVRQPMLSRAVLAELGGHAWPSNVRELQQTIEETLAIAHGGELTVDRIRSVLGRRTTRQPLVGVFPLRTLERDYIASVLVRCNWNQSLAARHLGIGRNTLMRKIRVFKLDRSEAA